MQEAPFAMTYSDRDGTIWLDGKMVPWRDAKVHVLTHTLHYGLGVFEGVRAYLTDRGGAIFRLREHTERLLASAKSVVLPIPYSLKELMQAQCEVLKANGLSEGYIRPICFFGSEGIGLRTDQLETHVAIACWEWPSYLDPKQVASGLSMMTSSIRRSLISSGLARTKVNGNYISSILALEEVRRHGHDEALMLDEHGYVAEGSGDNIFVLYQSKLLTPEPVACLDGITRQTIMTLAEERGYEVKECRLTRDQVWSADEVFITGTAMEVAPVVRLDGREIGDGQIGPFTKVMQEAYRQAVRGQIMQDRQWLTYLDS